MKNEYGIETINGYVVIPNKEMWEKYKEYFSTVVPYENWDNKPRYSEGHNPDIPDQFPCMVETEWYEDRDNYRYWSHSFTYKSELEDKLRAFNMLAVEMGDMAYSRIELETEEISKAFFSFLKAYTEHMYQWFGSVEGLTVGIDVGDNYLIINEDLEDE